MPLVNILLFVVLFVLIPLVVGLMWSDYKQKEREARIAMRRACMAERRRTNETYR